jgi:ABC-type microcin C transport system duplicated ATPase subunit YejF
VPVKCRRASVSFQLNAGEALRLVGESGVASPRSLAIVRYLGRAGRILAAASASRARADDLDETDSAIRGHRHGLPGSDGEPESVMTVGRQLVVPMTHEVSRRRRRARALAMLAEVKLADPDAVMERYRTSSPRSTAADRDRDGAHRARRS